MSDVSIMWLAVGTGGAVGAVLRGVIFRALEKWSPADAGGLWAELGAARSTVIVNVLGSFLLGCLVGSVPIPTGGSSDPVLAFWVTGLCGAVTTFSTLCADAVGLARRSGRAHVVAALLANTLLGIAALVLGLAIMA